LAKEELMKFEGVVIDVLPAAMFKVKLSNDHIITATVGGRLRQNNIRILLGDKVDVEASVYDLTKGRITYRR
jgi:translation initiation factor IF-1